MEPFQVGSFLTAGALLVIGLWALLMVDNVIKKIIGANLIADGVNLVLVGIGYRPGGFIPEVMHYFYETATPSDYYNLLEFGEFASIAGYPLPFVLVLTNIVISASTLAVMLALAIVLYNKYNTLSVQKMFEEAE